MSGWSTRSASDVVASRTAEPVRRGVDRLRLSNGDESLGSRSPTPGEAPMATNTTLMTVLAFSAVGAVGVIAGPVAGADPNCGGPDAVLWGDYCYVGDQAKQPPAPPSI